MHYLLAVLHKADQSIEELLEPYYEGIEAAPYIARTKAEIIEEAKKIKEELLNNPQKSYLPIRASLLIKCQTDEEFYNASVYDDCLYDEYGNELSTYNPDAKWDWYEIGGRWNNILRTKDGKKTNSCLLKNLDLTPDDEIFKQASEYWENNISVQNDGMSEEIRKYYKSKENFAKLNSIFHSHAVLDTYGLWHEPEFTWDMEKNEKEEIKWQAEYCRRFLENADDDLIITVVDYHI